MTKFQYQIYFPFKNIKQYVFLNSKGRHLVKKKTRDTSFKNNEKCFFFEKKKKKRFAPFKTEQQLQHGVTRKTSTKI